MAAHDLTTADSLGSLAIGLAPRAPCLFRLDPARSLHAALLRRLERLDPALSAGLHDAPAGAHGIARPWTVSTLSGPFDAHPDGLLARPGRAYWARVTALTTPVLAAIQEALDAPLSRGTPLDLEHVSFDIVEADRRATETWERRTSYAALLDQARPRRQIQLAWLSPTAFRRGRGYAPMPEPRLCLASYLRRWNAFADPELRIAEEPLLAYAEAHVHVAEVSLRSQPVRLGGFGVVGQLGRMRWRCDPSPEALLRQVNALADYAFYCGTGIKTALGMGQTVVMGRRSVSC